MIRCRGEFFFEKKRKRNLERIASQHLRHLHAPCDATKIITATNIIIANRFPSLHTRTCVPDQIYELCCFRTRAHLIFLYCYFCFLFLFHNSIYFRCGASIGEPNHKAIRSNAEIATRRVRAKKKKNMPWRNNPKRPIFNYLHISLVSFIVSFPFFLLLLLFHLVALNAFSSHGFVVQKRATTNRDSTSCVNVCSVFGWRWRDCCLFYCHFCFFRFSWFPAHASVAAMLWFSTAFFFSIRWKMMMDKKENKGYE